jgi:hypothetical protein
MANSNNRTKNNNQNTITVNSNEKQEQKKIKVLYQFLGGQWYAFAEDSSEVYFGKVPLNNSAKKTTTKNTQKDAAKKDGNK